jgi:hypothetical protein
LEQVVERLTANAVGSPVPFPMRISGILQLEGRQRIGSGFNFRMQSRIFRVGVTTAEAVGRLSGKAFG